MPEWFLRWAGNPETWLNWILPLSASFLLQRVYPWLRKKFVRAFKSAAANRRRRVLNIAGDDVLTTKAIVSREVWLGIFIIVGIGWFGFVVISPLRPLLELGVPASLFLYAPVFVIEFLFLNRDALADEVLAERKTRSLDP